MIQEKPWLEPIAENFYKIVCLRGCCRGPPLIPFDEPSETTTIEQIGGWYWQANEEGMFTFPAYLQKLIRTCGSDTRVFSSLDGRRLVPYQAAVLRSEWDLIEKKLKDLFSAQCSAYRFLRGGSGAPKLKAEVNARFVSESKPLSEPTKLSLDDFMIFKVEHNTFLDFQVAQDNFINPNAVRKPAEYP
eukprot:TRINITY_DN4694_c0_g1_i10.p2 TRINITY_DN4694_c0_g1~~TRINITY_DN4694_c0_g1_i10.p2  ORF type:complete len:188 (+),score=33.56 TRINITY_DN4694_c0_g1_i10:203-766(+)